MNFGPGAPESLPPIYALAEMPISGPHFQDSVGQAVVENENINTMAISCHLSFITTFVCIL